MPHAVRRRDAFVVVLTLTTGAVDAATFLRLGNVFSSVITGNLVLLGIAAGRGAGSLAVSGGLALAGYAAGNLLGATLAGTYQRDQPAWPIRVTVALGALAVTQAPAWLPVVILTPVAAVTAASLAGNRRPGSGEG